MTNAILETRLTCPKCGAVHDEVMPTDACQWFYECAACKTVLTPLEGDCCVFCSYADQKCPPLQAGDHCCG
ncbi:MAG: GDCCVxC domain-containing (seleno)protein [Paracoccaceae bacterium]|nr:GDCCVxC domain-containing (seleno)protein [Paracoccaceae bacterium]MDP7185260.1 GDCCVxC domain-containing (seleno)protein [Paracoccaceae bacterium]